MSFNPRYPVCKNAVRFPMVWVLAKPGRQTACAWNRQKSPIVKLKKKLNTGHLLSAFRENSPLKRSEWQVLARDLTVFFVTHKFIHEWNEPFCLWSPAIAHHRTFWPVLISRPTEGRRLSWPCCLVTYRGDMPARRWSSIHSQYEPTYSSEAGDRTQDHWVASPKP